MACFLVGNLAHRAARPVEPDPLQQLSAADVLQLLLDLLDQLADGAGERGVAVCAGPNVQAGAEAAHEAVDMGVEGWPPGVGGDYHIAMRMNARYGVLLAVALVLVIACGVWLAAAIGDDPPPRGPSARPVEHASGDAVASEARIDRPADQLVRESVSHPDPSSATALAVDVLAASGARFAGAGVFVWPYQGPSQGMDGLLTKESRSDGPIMFPLPPGRYSVTCTASGRSPIVEVVSGEVAKVALTVGELIACEGRLFGPEGEAVTGARVMVTSPISTAASYGGGQTDQQGRFSLAGVPPAAHVHFVAVGYENSPCYPAILWRSGIFDVHLRAESGELRIQVLGGPRRDAIAGAKVVVGSFEVRSREYAKDSEGRLQRLLDAPPTVVLSGQDGRASITGLGSEEYPVIVSKVGFQAWIGRHVAERPGQVVEVELEEARPVDGRIIMEDGSAAVGAKIGLLHRDTGWRQTATADAAGRFEFPSAPGGAIVLGCRHGGARCRLDIAADESRTTLVMWLAAEISVSGGFRNGSRSDGMGSGVRVAAMDRSSEVASARVARGSKFTLRGLKAQDYDLIAISEAGEIVGAYYGCRAPANDVAVSDACAISVSLPRAPRPTAGRLRLRYRDLGDWWQSWDVSPQDGGRQLQGVLGRGRVVAQVISESGGVVHWGEGRIDAERGRLILGEPKLAESKLAEVSVNIAISGVLRGRLGLRVVDMGGRKVFERAVEDFDSGMQVTVPEGRAWIQLTYFGGVLASRPVGVIDSGAQQGVYTLSATPSEMGACGVVMPGDIAEGSEVHVFSEDGALVWSGAAVPDARLGIPAVEGMYDVEIRSGDRRQRKRLRLLHASPGREDARW